MRDYITIGPAPSDEDCVQLESGGDYWADMKAECNRYRDYLEGMFPFWEQMIDDPDDLHGGARFTVKTHVHDFGRYAEVAVVYDDNSRLETEFAIFVEHHTPRYWGSDKVYTIEDMQVWAEKEREEQNV